jgi:hypothetical protein
MLNAHSNTTVHASQRNAAHVTAAGDHSTATSLRSFSCAAGCLLQADAAAFTEQLALMQQQLDASQQQAQQLQSQLRDKTERGARLRQGYEK